MPAPKRANTTAATEAAAKAARLRRLEANAAELHAAGWFLVAPERADEVRLLVSTSSSYTEDWGDAEWRPLGKDRV